MFHRYQFCYFTSVLCGFARLWPGFLPPGLVLVLLLLAVSGLVSRPLRAAPFALEPAQNGISVYLPFIESAHIPPPAATTTWQAVAGGERHTCGLTLVGGVQCWGDNFYGQLGDGSHAGFSQGVDSVTPVDVAGLTTGAHSVVAGLNHSCALITGGGVKCWGKGADGQLGDGERNVQLAPVDVVGLGASVLDIAAGENHTCAVAAGGAVKCWGNNAFGQLGDATAGEFAGKYTPVDVHGLGAGVVDVEAGAAHTCALTGAGAVFCWGANGVGQLGNGIPGDRAIPVNVTGLGSGVQAIVSGGAHTCALLSSGGVKCWGLNRFGALGDNTRTNRDTPVDVVGLASGVHALALARNHTCALMSAGGAKCWGPNGFGQLGTGTIGVEAASNTPVDVVELFAGLTHIGAGVEHTCVRLAGGGMKCWGGNFHGMLGDGTSGFNSSQSTPVDVVGFGP